MKQIHIEDAAFAGGYSVSYFSRLFQSQLGLSFTDYLQSIRLKHVKSDLISTDRSIMDIAIDNGFIYAGNMSSCFRKKTGMTPTQFRRKIKEK
jgi:AraC-like DNA-binding protein